ncbi:MAG TPA: MFS transporter [Holophagaceae bacterium]|nr:MFS transporter [Holophagaceae bacterium]
MSDRAKANAALAMSTLAFFWCFACWTLNGVLGAFLVDNGLFHWNQEQLGWILGIPVLTGSVLRLPVGMLADRFGGRRVYTALLFLSAVPMWLLGSTHSYGGFLLASLGFGLTGASFAVGVAFTSSWFPKAQQGTALGIFGAGNVGTALTALFAPTALKALTKGGTDLEAWRTLPKLYAVGLVLIAVAFLLVTREHVSGRPPRTLAQLLSPMKRLRVWRFGLYYFLVFGCFVALSQWLVPYYMGVYGMSLAAAGALAASFSLPAGLVRAAGGWLADRYGARTVIYWAFAGSVVACLALSVPRMTIESPGPAVQAPKAGVVTEVAADHIALDGVRLPLRTKAPEPPIEAGTFVMPHSTFWQEPAVKPGDKVTKKQVLAKGVTRIFFQANVKIFAGIVLVLGLLWGVGMGAVYKYIPTYFPDEVGAVGGLVGVIGGLGGFVGPIVFGYVLKTSGLWTTMWVMLAALSLTCLVMLHLVVQRIIRREKPEIAFGTEPE